jgi:hypothetical protein
MKALDPYLRPLNSPIVQNQGAVPAYEFDYRNERGVIRSAQIQDASITNAKIGTAAIGTAQIGTLSFNEISGGTATFGGTSNGNGVVLVKDAGGTTKVTMNNTGITIQDGKLTFLNSSGGTILDGSGIVSQANFAIDGITSASEGTTASDTYIDVPGSSMDSFILIRPAIALIIGLSAGYNVGRASDSDFGMSVKVNDSVNGDLISYSHNGNWIITGIDFPGESYGLNVVGDYVSFSIYVALSAGTHTLKLQFRRDGGGTATLETFLMYYNILGS